MIVSRPQNVKANFPMCVGVFAYTPIYFARAVFGKLFLI